MINKELLRGLTNTELLIMYVKIQQRLDILEEMNRKMKTVFPKSEHVRLKCLVNEEIIDRVVNGKLDSTLHKDK